MAAQHEFAAWARAVCFLQLGTLRGLPPEVHPFKGGPRNPGTSVLTGTQEARPVRASALLGPVADLRPILGAPVARMTGRAVAMTYRADGTGICPLRHRWHCISPDLQARDRDQPRQTWTRRASAQASPFGGSHCARRLTLEWGQRQMMKPTMGQ